MIESTVQASGPEDRPAGSGGERQNQAWALGIAAFAGPGGGWPARRTGAPQGWGRAECGLLEDEGEQGLRRSELWPASR